MTNNHWYAIDNSGMATLCVDEQDARRSAIEYAELYPKRAPYVVGQICQPVTAATTQELERTKNGARILERALEDARAEIDRLKAAAVPADSSLNETPPFLQEDDQHDLHRFIETTEDGQGYDIGKDRIKRLADLGVVSNQGFGRYSVTAFGYWAHERYWHQNPSLPLKTIDEHNAEAAIDARRRIEVE